MDPGRNITCTTPPRGWVKSLLSVTHAANGKFVKYYVYPIWKQKTIFLPARIQGWHRLVIKDKFTLLHKLNSVYI